MPKSLPKPVDGSRAYYVQEGGKPWYRASLDQRHRLLSFGVAALDPLPDLPDLPDLVGQTAFFERHELVVPPRSIEQADLTQGVITDLSDDEIATFMAALEME